MSGLKVTQLLKSNYVLTKVPSLSRPRQGMMTNVSPDTGVGVCSRHHFSGNSFIKN